MDDFTCAEEWDDMDRGTESGREGDLESDAFQDFDGDSDKRGSIGPHEERKINGEEREGHRAVRDAERAWRYV